MVEEAAKCPSDKGVGGQLCGYMLRLFFNQHDLGSTPSLQKVLMTGRRNPILRSGDKPKSTPFVTIYRDVDICMHSRALTNQPALSAESL